MGCLFAQSAQNTKVLGLSPGLGFSREGGLEGLDSKEKDDPAHDTELLFFF